MPWRATIVQTCRAYSENGRFVCTCRAWLRMVVPSSVSYRSRERATPYAEDSASTASANPQRKAGGPSTDCRSAAHELEQPLNPLGSRNSHARKGTCSRSASELQWGRG
jgi:hypothetical protein